MEEGVFTTRINQKIIDGNYDYTSRVTRIFMIKIINRG